MQSRYVFLFNFVTYDLAVSQKKQKNAENFITVNCNTFHYHLSLSVDLALDESKKRIVGGWLCQSSIWITMRVLDFLSNVTLFQFLRSISGVLVQINWVNWETWLISSPKCWFLCCYLYFNSFQRMCLFLSQWWTLMYLLE